MTTPHSPFRFAVAATFTADLLRPVVTFWGKQLHYDFETRFAGFNQVLQSLLDPGSELGANNHGVNIVLLRLEDLGRTEDEIHSNVSHVGDELRAAATRFSVPLLVALCPSPWGAPKVDRFESVLASALAPIPGAHLLTGASVAERYPVQEVHNPAGNRLGGIPYTEAYYCALGTALVRHTHGLFRAPFKLIALDCDNTLWQGICGEDGPENVVLDPARRALHEFMRIQRDDGALLALASKNNEEDVLETFRLHPEMPLQLRHFVTWRLNWDTKAANLSSISEQLGLALDSFVFIDDNPKECAELQDSLPDVLTLALPVDIGSSSHYLHHVWAFDHPSVTEEDRKRNAFYAQAAEFGNEARRARSFADFLESLDLRVRIARARPDDVARVAQLTQRTNQFNTTTIRRSDSEVASLLRDGADVMTVDVSDRFGDYGLVGVLILRSTPEAVEVDTMLLSCRALGRGVEHRMIALVAREAVAGGAAIIRIPFVRTSRNQPAHEFLENLPAAEPFEERDTGFVVEVRPAKLVDFAWTPDSGRTAERPVRTLRPEASARRVDYARIAESLSTVPAILGQMREGQPQSCAATDSDESMTDIERRLANIWADLLERSPIRRTDNFFDSGGHSLAAVLLLMRVREAFDVELSIDDVYSSGLTLADLALRIEAASLGDLGAEEYAALLSEIENLTDEEARELLARENGRG